MAQVANLVAEAPDVQWVPASACRNADVGGAGDSGFCKSVRLFLVDPDRGAAVTDAATAEYKWDGGRSHCVAIMKSGSILEVVDKVRGKIHAGTTVRAIYVALRNPATGTIIPDAMHLQSDEEVEAFF